MQLRSRLAAIVAAVVVVTGLAACGQAGRAPVPARPASSAPPRTPPAGTPSAAASKPPFSTVQLTTAPQRIKALGGALLNAGSRQLLWSRGLETERPMGSITKVMTALVVLRSGALNREIRVPRSVLAYVTRYQAESGGLHPGDVLTTRDLLNAMLLQSACDAAYTLALAYGPGMPAFLAKMNALAAQLGMTHTHFTSPDGLPYPTEYATYSTPADLLTLGLAAMRVPAFRAIVDQQFYRVPKVKGQHHAYWWGNTNELIGDYPGAVGIKTGYTDAARHCLLFEAVRHGETLLGVVLGSPVTGPDAADQAATRLLNWGFGVRLR